MNIVNHHLDEIVVLPNEDSTNKPTFDLKLSEILEIVKLTNQYKNKIKELELDKQKLQEQLDIIKKIINTDTITDTITDTNIKNNSGTNIKNNTITDTYTQQNINIITPPRNKFQNDIKVIETNVSSLDEIISKNLFPQNTQM
jgi:7-cyano-7-deazaguanine synthase in queuosine biosynthesis